MDIAASWSSSRTSAPPTEHRQCWVVTPEEAAKPPGSTRLTSCPAAVVSMCKPRGEEANCTSTSGTLAISSVPGCRCRPFKLLKLEW